MRRLTYKILVKIFKYKNMGIASLGNTPTIDLDLTRFYLTNRLVLDTLCRCKTTIKGQVSTTTSNLVWFKFRWLSMVDNYGFVNQILN
jgi:hypothetical protein